MPIRRGKSAAAAVPLSAAPRPDTTSKQHNAPRTIDFRFMVMPRVSLQGTARPLLHAVWRYGRFKTDISPCGPFKEYGQAISNGHDIARVPRIVRLEHELLFRAESRADLLRSREFSSGILNPPRGIF